MLQDDESDQDTVDMESDSASSESETDDENTLVDDRVAKTAPIAIPKRSPRVVPPRENVEWERAQKVEDARRARECGVPAPKNFKPVFMDDAPSKKKRSARDDSDDEYSSALDFDVEPTRSKGRRSARAHARTPVVRESDPAGDFAEFVPKAERFIVGFISLLTIGGFAVGDVFSQRFRQCTGMLANILSASSSIARVCTSGAGVFTHGTACSAMKRRFSPGDASKANWILEWLHLKQKQPTWFEWVGGLACVAAKWLRETFSALGTKIFSVKFFAGHWELSISCENNEKYLGHFVFQIIIPFGLASIRFRVSLAFWVVSLYAIYLVFYHLFFAPSKRSAHSKVELSRFGEKLGRVYDSHGKFICNTSFIRQYIVLPAHCDYDKRTRQPYAAYAVFEHKGVLYRFELRDDYRKEVDGTHEPMVFYSFCGSPLAKALSNPQVRVPIQTEILILHTMDESGKAHISFGNLLSDGVATYDSVPGDSGGPVTAAPDAGGAVVGINYGRIDNGPGLIMPFTNSMLSFFTLLCPTKF
jgi:hypothetical protein